MSVIGGYFELELSRGREYHKNAIRLNSARNSLEYILIAKKYEKIYLPYYICEAILQPVNRLGLEYEFYKINEKFEVEFDFNKTKNHEAFLYVNYFGLMDNYIPNLKGNCSNLVIDNAQAFYSKPFAGVDTFYSPRKFFGIPDGSYLYTDEKVTFEINQEVSYDKFEHLLKRIDLGAESGYTLFLENEKNLSSKPIHYMSNLTQSILQSIDYKKISKTRRSNYVFLDTHLKSSNRIDLQLGNSQVPLVYPYLSINTSLRNKLINDKIFIAQYWPNVLNWANKNSIEYNYASNIVHLPVDQRYSTSDLKKIISILKNEC